jgi:segregation and condensation protein B
VDRPLRLISREGIADNPIDALARTVEALLVVASQPLTPEQLVDATEDDLERVETALGLLSERYREGRSGIVLERAAGGYAFRAAREAAEACGRLFERPVERGLSQAALETLAIVAYMGPVSRPEIARIRGVAADSTVASLVERGLIAEAGREAGPGGAVRYRATPLFERVFGLDSLAELPRLDDLGADTESLRDRLLEVAGARAS